MKINTRYLFFLLMLLTVSVFGIYWLKDYLELKKISDPTYAPNRWEILFVFYSFALYVHHDGIFKKRADQKKEE